MNYKAMILTFPTFSQQMATKAPIPPVDTGATEILAWRSGAWVNDPAFAQISYVDSEIASVIGTATTSYDDLGKIEGILVNVASDISTIQTSVATNTASIAQEITDRGNADSAIIGGASASYDTLGKVKSVITALDAAYKAEDLNLQNQITTNDSDITTLQTDVAANTLNIATNTTDIGQEKIGSNCSRCSYRWGSQYKL